METPMCLNIPNGEFYKAVPYVQWGIFHEHICSTTASWDGWDGIGLVFMVRMGISWDFSGFIQTLESDCRTNGGVSRKKMDRLTHTRTHIYIIFQQQTWIKMVMIFHIWSAKPGISAAQMWMSCWVYTLIVEYGWIWGILKKTMNHHQAPPPFFFKLRLIQPSSSGGRHPLFLFFWWAFRGSNRLEVPENYPTKVTSLTDLTWTSL